MGTRAFGLAVLLSGLSTAAVAAPSEADIESRMRLLDFGLWNNRINALYDAGDMGVDGLPLLRYASDDADWQVRLTAAHFMGKLGLAAAPALGEIAPRMSATWRTSPTGLARNEWESRS